MKATPALDKVEEGPLLAVLPSNWLENPVTAAKSADSTMLPTHSLVRRPIQSFVADPAMAPTQDTIEFIKVRSSRRSTLVIPRMVYIEGR